MPTQIGSIGLGLQDIQQLVLLYVIGSPWFLPLKSATCRSDVDGDDTSSRDYNINKYIINIQISPSLLCTAHLQFHTEGELGYALLLFFLE